MSKFLFSCPVCSLKMEQFLPQTAPSPAGTIDFTCPSCNVTLPVQIPRAEDLELSAGSVRFQIKQFENQQQLNLAKRAAALKQINSFSKAIGDGRDGDDDEDRDDEDGDDSAIGSGGIMQLKQRDRARRAALDFLQSQSARQFATLDSSDKVSSSASADHLETIHEAPAAVEMVVVDSPSDSLRRRPQGHQRMPTEEVSEAALRSYENIGPVRAAANSVVMRESLRASRRVQMCDICKKTKARVECRDEQCAKIAGTRFFCQSCNEQTHEGLNHARVEYLQNTFLSESQASSAIPEDDEQQQQLESKKQDSQLMRLNTQHAIVDNAVMESWRNMHRCTKLWFRLLTAVWDCFSLRRRSLPFWTSTIKNIEASQGSSIAAWFFFAKWIFMLNLVLAFMFCVVIVPSLFAGSYHVGAWGNLKGLVVGTGMENTFFFYGAYQSTYFGNSVSTVTRMQNTTVWNAITNSSILLVTPVTTTEVVPGRFKMDLAWFLVSSGALMMSLLATIAHVDEETGKSKSSSFCELVFGRFNHRVCEPGAAVLQQTWIATTLRSMMKEQIETMKSKKKFSKRSFIRRACGIGSSIVVIAITVTVISLLIYYEHPSATRPPIYGFSSVYEWLQANTPIPDVFLLYVVPFVVFVLKATSPTLIQLLISLEDRPPSTAFRHLFIREFALRMFFVLAVMFQTFNSASTQSCIESAVGIVFYRLILFDFFIDVLFSTVVPFLVLFVKQTVFCGCLRSSKSNDQVGLLPHQIDDDENSLKSEFDIPGALLNLMYRQTLIWSGAAYAPILPFVGVVLGFMEVGIKAFEIKLYRRATQNLMGVSRQNKFFRSLLVVTLLVSVVPYAYFLRLTSKCGPFRDSGDQGIQVYQNFLAYVDQAPTWVAVMLTYCTNAVLLWLLISLSLLSLFMMWRRASLLQRELTECDVRLRMEQLEKTAIIRSYHIKFDVSASELFKSFMLEEMGELAQAYAPKMLDCGLGDLNQLLQMPETQLMEDLELKVQMPSKVAKLFMVKLKQLQNDRI